jgi:hypothetical protein
MQKAAIVVLPVAVLAVVVCALVLRRDAQPSRTSESSKKSAATDSAAASETARLRAELETLRKEEEKQRKRAESAEARLAGAAAASSNSNTAADAKKAAAKRADWKTRRDSELEAKVKTMAWRKNVKGVINYWKEIEAARAEGRSVQYSPELMAPLNALQANMNELARFLGIEGEDSFRVFHNEVVHEAWMDAIVQEIGGGDVTEAQLARLRQTSLYDPDPDWEFGESNLLESWKVQVEKNRVFTSETVGILTADQHALISRTVTPSYLLSTMGYSERSIPGGAQAPQAIADFWQKSFKIPDDQRAALEAAAADYVRRHAEIAQAVSAQHGGLKSREAEFDLLLKTIEAQVAAEKKLAETLLLDPELAKKFLQSSGAVLRLTH